jgi:genome maintenance exonuclease 1
MAHDYVYGSKIRQGVIMICTPDLYYQEFKFQDIELRKWKHKFLKRLDMYHEIQFDEKENVIKQGTAHDLLQEMTKERK